MTRVHIIKGYAAWYQPHRIMIESSDEEKVSYLFDPWSQNDGQPQAREVW